MLTESLVGQSAAPQGLQKGFQKGEQFPWKGIWFEVAAVGPDSLLMKPIGTTVKRHKEIQEAKNHGKR